MTIDTSKLRVSTKSLAAAVTALGTLWQIRAVHDGVLAFVSAHPHYSGIFGAVGVVWALLHDPQVREVCGMDGATQ